MAVAVAEIHGPIGPLLAYRYRQRSVLRPRRQADGDEPGRAIAEVRTPRSGAFDGAADRLYELQLSSRSFRYDMESQDRNRRGGAYRLCRVRHRPAGVGAVCDPRP